MLGYGLTNAVLPIIAFNYGRKNRERVKKAILSALGIAAVVAVFGTILFECIPEVLLGCFNASSETTAAGFTELYVLPLPASSSPYSTSSSLAPSRPSEAGFIP